MSAQIPTERPSLTKTLEQRYATQHAGGAFNAVNISKTGHASLTIAGNSSLQSATYTPSGFKLQQPIMVTEFKDSALNTAAKNGHTNKKYKP
jgi:hypothetical protein